MKFLLKGKCDAPLARLLYYALAANFVFALAVALRHFGTPAQALRTAKARKYNPARTMREVQCKGGPAMVRKGRAFNPRKARLPHSGVPAHMPSDGSVPPKPKAGSRKELQDPSSGFLQMGPCVGLAQVCFGQRGKHGSCLGCKHGECF